MTEFKIDREKERGEARKAYCEVTDGLAIENKSNCQPLPPNFPKIKPFAFQPASTGIMPVSMLFLCAAAQVLSASRTTSAGLESGTLPSQKFISTKVVFTAFI